MINARRPKPIDVGRGRCALAEAEHRIRLLATLADALAGLGMLEEALEACREVILVQAHLDQLRANRNLQRRRLTPVET
jgi:hypothetical protein